MALHKERLPVIPIDICRHEVSLITSDGRKRCTVCREVVGNYEDEMDFHSWSNYLGGIVIKWNHTGQEKTVNEIRAEAGLPPIN